MIGRLGGRVSLELEDGRSLGVPGSLLYDPSGEAWPRCSLLVTSFSRDGREAEDVPKFWRGWFGGEYDARRGSIYLPSRDIGDWSVGQAVRRILYDRSGIEHDGPMDHVFGSAGGLFRRLSFGGKLPVFYRQGRAVRIELGSGCAITPAGIVSP